jgi:hypothetical protein
VREGVDSDGLRGLLRELGFGIPVGATQLLPHVAALVADADSRLVRPHGSR